MQSRFIEVSGVVINIEQIGFIDFRKPGRATIHVASNAIETEDEATVEGLKRFFLPQTPQTQPPQEPSGE